MTDWLPLVTPLAVLAVLALYRFVGCTLLFPLESPPPPDPETYATIVQGEAVAYWRLGDQAGAVQAVDQLGAHPGTYTSPGALPASTTLHSAAAPGTVALGEPPLRGEGSDALTSARFDGGLVRVEPFSAALNPATFSLEAWVKPDWALETQPNYHVVVAAFERAPGNTHRGFILQAGPDPAIEDAPSGPTFWQVRVGTGGAAIETVLGTQFDPGTKPRTHLVVTCDGSTLELWVDGGVEAGTQLLPTNSRTLAAAFAPNQGRPLFIGAGRTEVDAQSPRFPFVGWIQDVSLYSTVLTPEQIARHALKGDGVL